MIKSKNEYMNDSEAIKKANSMDYKDQMNFGRGYLGSKAKIEVQRRPNSNHNYKQANGSNDAQYGEMKNKKTHLNIHELSFRELMEQYVGSLARMNDYASLPANIQSISSHKINGTLNFLHLLKARICEIAVGYEIQELAIVDAKYGIDNSSNVNYLNSVIQKQQSYIIALEEKLKSVGISSLL